MNVEQVLSKNYSKIFEGKLVSCDVSEYRDVDGKVRGIWLARIFTPPSLRHKGYGNIVMSEFLGICDKCSCDVYLVICAYGGIEFNVLESWYLKLGFKEVEEGLYRRCYDRTDRYPR